MSKKFKDHGAGYFVYHDEPFNAIIKKSGLTWYGGAVFGDGSSVPLHGPFLTKRKARKVALREMLKLDSWDF